MNTHYKNRSTHHLIDQICNRSGGTPNYALLIGAGASISSGVPSANTMIQDWRKQMFSRSGSKEKFEDWIKQQSWYQDEDEYSILFESVYDQPSQRRIYIENCVKDAKPAWGYIYLANIIANGCINVVFTPNFDDLLNEACFLYTDQKPIVCAHDSAVSDIRISSKRPKIIKLHGDYLYDTLKNTIDETANLEKNMRDKFMQFAREYGLILIGYGGNDRSIMDILDIMLRSEGYLPHGLYWCILENDLINKKLDRLFTREKTYCVKIDGFDDFMAELHESLGLSLTETVRDPYKATTNRLNSFIIPSTKTENPIIKKDINILEKIIRSFEDNLSGNKLENEIDRLVPYKLLGDLDYANHKYKDAITNYNKALIQTPNDFTVMSSLGYSYSAIEEYDKALDLGIKMIDMKPDGYEGYLRKGIVLENTGHVKEALDFFDKSLKLSPNALITQAIKVYISNSYLILKEWEKAINVIEEALKLDNKIDYVTFVFLINKAMALKGLKREPEATDLFKNTLTKTKDSYLRACIYAGLADKHQMLTALAAAINEDISSKKAAKLDPDFMNYRDDADFRKLVFD